MAERTDMRGALDPGSYRHRQSPERAPVRLFGVPVGGFGVFLSLLLACVAAVMSFFLFTFLGIIGIAIYNGVGHRVDYADSYRFFALPAGCLILIVSLIFFGSLWLRQRFSHS